MLVYQRVVYFYDVGTPLLYTPAMRVPSESTTVRTPCRAVPCTIQAHYEGRTWVVAVFLVGCPLGIGID